MISAFVPVLRCSLMRTLISSSWWRSEVSRCGRRSPTLGCSLAMAVSVLEGWSEELSEGVRPFLPAWSTPGATHQYSLQAPLHHTRVNSYTFLRISSYLGLAATWQHQLGSDKNNIGMCSKKLTMEETFLAEINLTFQLFKKIQVWLWWKCFMAGNS